MTDNKCFNPAAYLIRLGDKIYLPVRYRIAWFRCECPGGRIATELVAYQHGIVIFKASIIDPEGVIIATGYGSAVISDGAGNGSKGQRAPVWAGREVEKAETAAIGRALGHAGYGTQFADDAIQDEEEHLADAPTQARKRSPKASPSNWATPENLNYLVAWLNDGSPDHYQIPGIDLDEMGALVGIAPGSDSGQWNARYPDGKRALAAIIAAFERASGGSRIADVAF